MKVYRTGELHRSAPSALVRGHHDGCKRVSKHDSIDRPARRKASHTSYSQTHSPTRLLPNHAGYSKIYAARGVFPYIPPCLPTWLPARIPRYMRQDCSADIGAWSAFSSDIDWYHRRCIGVRCSERVGRDEHGAQRRPNRTGNGFDIGRHLNAAYGTVQNALHDLAESMQREMGSSAATRVVVHCSRDRPQDTPRQSWACRSLRLGQRAETSDVIGGCHSVGISGDLCAFSRSLDNVPNRKCHGPVDDLPEYALNRVVPDPDISAPKAALAHDRQNLDQDIRHRRGHCGSQCVSLHELDNDCLRAYHHVLCSGLKCGCRGESISTRSCSERSGASSGSERARHGAPLRSGIGVLTSGWSCRSIREGQRGSNGSDKHPSRYGDVHCGEGCGICYQRHSCADMSQCRCVRAAMCSSGRSGTYAPARGVSNLRIHPPRGRGAYAGRHDDVHS